MPLLKFLLLEDSENDATAILLHLKRAGYQVNYQRVETAQQMQQALVSTVWDVIISAYNLTSFSALDALQILKSGGRDIPFIIVADASDEELIVQSMKAGAYDYLTKSNLARLVPAIEREQAEVENRRARRAAEEELRVSQRRLETALAVSDVGVWERDLHTEKMTFSQNCLRILGMTTPTETLEETLQYIHPDDTGKILNAMRSAVENASTFQEQLRYFRPDGEMMWLETYGKPDYNADGQPSRIIGAVKDITSFKRLENELRASAERFRTLAENSVAGVTLCERDGTLRYVNDAYLRIIGYTRVEFDQTEMNWKRLTAPEYRERDLLALAQADERGSSEIYEKEYIRQNGTRIPVLLALSRLDDREQYIATILDNTAHKTAEESLRKSQEDLLQAQKMESVGRLAGGIAHDFNNMLTAINGFSDLILYRLDADSPIRPQVESIKRAGDRAAALTRQLLAFSRRQILQPKTLELNQVVKDTSTMLRRLIGEDITLISSPDEQTGQVTVDPAQMTQVLLNLVLNARDAMPQGGTLTIATFAKIAEASRIAPNSALASGDYAVLQVTDTGTGIAPEHLPEIFEPFFTTKDVGKGTGLGLSTAYGIVKQSGGQIEVDSELGRGTTFRIYLPRVEPKAGSDAEKLAPTEIHRGSATILLVEDEEMVRQLSREVLESCGYSVLEASNGIEALKQYGSRAGIDLLMTDVVMPEMGGRELAEEMTRINPALRVLFASGYADDPDTRNNFMQRNVDFIQKPFHLETLTRVIRDLLN